MKWALMIVADSANIGDNMQVLAIINLYKQMGIEEEDLYKIKYQELKNYKGEYLVLPISLIFAGYLDMCKIFCFSEHIIPVFLGVSLYTDCLGEEDVSYLKKFSPIGCRDNFTLNTMRKYGIVSYLNGCMTMTFPKVNYNAVGKIFCVDIPDIIKQYIPPELLNEAINITHHYSTKKHELDMEMCAKKTYEKYIKEARLIITSRLHCALPCIAAGIPVVFVKREITTQIDWLLSTVKIYFEEEYERINWNPQPIEIEKLKNKLISCAKKRMMEAYNKYEEIYNISLQYEAEISANIIWGLEKVKQHIVEIGHNNYNFQYSFWGITQPTVIINTYIKQNYPDARLCHVYDKSKEGFFEGKKIEKPNNISSEESIVFVTAYTAIEDVEDAYKLNKIKNYYICVE